MKISDIRSYDLRSFAEQRVMEARENRKGGKVGCSDLVDIWDSWLEADWHHFRQALIARAECERLGHTRDEQDRAVARVLDRQPPIFRNGNRYRPAWTWQIEAAGLCELANIDPERFAVPPPVVLELKL